MSTPGNTEGLPSEVKESPVPDAISDPKFAELPTTDHRQEGPAPEALTGQESGKFSATATGENSFPDSTTMAAQEAASGVPAQVGSEKSLKSNLGSTSTVPSGFMTEHPSESLAGKLAATPSQAPTEESGALSESTTVTEPDTQEGAIADSSPTTEPVSVPPAEKALDVQGGPAPVGGLVEAPVVPPSPGMANLNAAQGGEPMPEFSDVRAQVAATPSAQPETAAAQVEPRSAGAISSTTEASSQNTQEPKKGWKQRIFGGLLGGYKGTPAPELPSASEQQPQSSQASSGQTPQPSAS